MSEIEVVLHTGEEISVRHQPSGSEFEFRVGPASRELMDGPVHYANERDVPKTLAEEAHAFAERQATILGIL